MSASNRPMGDSQHRTHWGEPKRCRSISCTDTCWELLTKLALANNTNRSEALERLVRHAAQGES